MFLHAGYMHLIGNMLFLFLAGCAIEDVWGRPLFIAFYFVSGIVATISFQIASSNSMVALVGASGAIAGLMGAFLIRLAKTQIRFFYLLFLLFFGFRTGTFNAPAYLMLPLWLLQQVVYASFHEGEGGVAFSAHIGGFVFGAAIALVMKFTQVEEKFIAPSIERKVSLEQNPLFLKGVQLAESKDYTGALIHLQKVVREDPSHFEAFMEMRRIAESTRTVKVITGTWQEFSICFYGIGIMISLLIYIHNIKIIHIAIFCLRVLSCQLHFFLKKMETSRRQWHILKCLWKNTAMINSR